jgi:hypothetical protein
MNADRRPFRGGDRSGEVVHGAARRADERDIAVSGMALDERTGILETELCGGGFDQADHARAPPGAVPGHRYGRATRPCAEYT